MEENQENVGKPKSNSKPTVPKSDSDFGTVALAVSVEWEKNPWMTLQYSTYQVYKEQTNMFLAILSSRKSDGGERPQISTALSSINAKIDGSVKHVKGYLAEIYGDKGKNVVQSYYPSFGIVQVGTTFEIPFDASNRKMALEMMLKAIEVNGFSDKKFGLAFWTDIKNQYDMIVETSRELDGGISDKVGEKKILKKALKKVLQSIILILKANFPDTYKEQLRKWGFQKEKY